jgi:hypothetical protein
MPRKYLQPPYIVRYSFQDSEHEWPIPRVEHEKESPDHLQEGGQRLALASIDLTILDSLLLLRLLLATKAAVGIRGDLVFREGGGKVHRGCVASRSHGLLKLTVRCF